MQNFTKKNITKNLAWCDDPSTQKYNEEIHTSNIKNQRITFIGKTPYI